MAAKAAHGQDLPTQGCASAMTVAKAQRVAHLLIKSCTCAGFTNKSEACFAFATGLAQQAAGADLLR
jgi:hypothetical protein